MKYFLLIWIFLTAASCGPRTINLASESTRQERSLCNYFNQNGFEGVLAINNRPEVNDNISGYDPSSFILKFDNIPTYFQRDRSSYIQLHLIKYEENVSSAGQSPINLTYFNDRASITPIRKTVIDHISISETNSNDMRSFLNDFKFILEDVRGWDALNIGIYNSVDQPIREYQVKTLIPPFASDPNLYEELNSSNPSLVEIHPFSEFLGTDETIEFFLERTQRFCERL